MTARALVLWTAALLIAASPRPAGASILPIYIEDNHAGTFYWLAQNIDLDQSYTLILFDAHSDASGIFDSDKIRDALRNVASRRIAKRCSIGGAAKALCNASTGSSRSCRRR